VLLLLYTSLLQNIKRRQFSVIRQLVKLSARILDAMGRQESNKINHVIINFTIFIEVHNTLLNCEKYSNTAASLAVNRVKTW